MGLSSWLSPPPVSGEWSWAELPAHSHAPLAGLGTAHELGEVEAMGRLSSQGAGRFCLRQVNPTQLCPPLLYWFACHRDLPILSLAHCRLAVACSHALHMLVCIILGTFTHSFSQCGSALWL